mgnify:CR=1 FL=1
MAKFEAHEEIIETMVDFKKGLRTLDTGPRSLPNRQGSRMMLPVHYSEA